MSEQETVLNQQHAARAHRADRRRWPFGSALQLRWGKYDPVHQAKCG
jgi:hypothetical protein